MSLIERACPTCGGCGKVRDGSFAATDSEFGWDRCVICNGAGKVVPSTAYRGAVDALREIRDEAVTMGRAWHVADRALKALGVPSPNAERGQ